MSAKRIMSARLVFALMMAGATCTMASAAIVHDVVLPMERDFDGIECKWNNDRSTVTNDGHSVRVSSPASVRDLHLSYSPGHCPGVRPFRGGPVVLETSGSVTGTVKLIVTALTGGKRFEFTAPWTERIRFETGFKASDLYVFQRLDFVHAIRKPWTVLVRSCRAEVTLPSAAACRLDVDTGNPLHISRDETEKPVVRIVNEAMEPLRFKGRIGLADLMGRKLDFPLDTGILKPCAEFRMPLPWPLPGKGLWLVGAEVRTDDGSRAVRETRFAVLDRHEITPVLEEGKFRMGINYHMERYLPEHRKLTLSAIVASGAKLVRAGIDAGWGHVQAKGRDSWNWSRPDRMLKELEGSGLALDTIIWGTPRWAAQPGRLADKSADWRTWALGLPVDLNDFGHFCEELGRRYGPRIAYYEIGNEWDLKGSNVLTRAEMSRATILGSQSVKRGDARAKVITNGWAGWNSKNSRVTQKGMPEGVMLDCKGHYDAHPVHNHGSFKTYREAVIDLVARRKNLGLDHVPWYANETAHSTVNGNEIPVGELVWKKILFAWAYGSCDYIWYNLRATSWNPKDPEQGFGMITPDYYPRASYAAFSALSAILCGFDADGMLKSERSREVFRFRGERKGVRELVIAGWDSALRQPGSIRIQTDARDARRVDFMGNSQPLSLKDGVCVWPIDKRPTALVLRGATVADPVATDLDDIPDIKIPEIRVGMNGWRGRDPDFVIDKVWQQQGLFEADPLTVDRVWQGPADCSFKGWVSRSEKGALACRVEVRDDVHSQTAATVRKMSEGDCLRVDVTPSGDGCWRFGFRRTDDGRSEACLWNAPGEKSKRSRVESAVEFTSERRDGTTIYEFSLPLSEMGVDAGKLARGVDVSFMVDDSDGEGRDLWMGPEMPIRVRIAETKIVGAPL